MYFVIDEGNITNVVTDEKYREQGIATKMLSVLFREAENKGVADIYLEVRKSNLKAIEFYNNIGFTNCGIRKKFYDKPEEDAILMKYNFIEKRGNKKEAYKKEAVWKRQYKGGNNKGGNKKRQYKRGNKKEAIKKDNKKRGNIKGNKKEAI